MIKGWVITGFPAMDAGDAPQELVECHHSQRQRSRGLNSGAASVEEGPEVDHLLTPDPVVEPVVGQVLDQGEEG